MTSMLVVLGAASALLVASLAVGLHLSQTVQFDSSDAAGPLLGSLIQSKADLATDMSQFGHMGAIRTYYTGLPNANAWTTGLPGTAIKESAVVVSFKANPSTILSGADDNTLSHFFDTAPTGHAIYYSYYHEPEDNIAKGEFTMDDYKAAWGRIVWLADQAHNPDLHSTLILKARDLDPKTGWNWKNYLPGGGVISTLGWDAYCAGCAVNINPQPTPPATFMGPAIAAAKSVGLPFGIAEFGLSTPVDRPAWMTTVGDYLMNSGAVFATLYNGDAQYPALKLTDSASIAVWHSFVSHSGNAPDPAPPASAPPAPTQPPTTGPQSDGIGISGLSISPGAFTTGSGNHTAITFTMSQSGDITICVLGSDGTVLRQLSRPAHAGGHVSVPYYGYNGHGKALPAGTYPVLVVASNSGGSATAEATLTIGAP